MLQLKYHPARDAAMALCAIVTFVWLAEVALFGPPSPFDLHWRQHVHSYAQPWITHVMWFASWLGSGWVLWPGGMLLAGLLDRAGRRRDALLFALAVVGANLINEEMKTLFHRSRPEAWFDYPLPHTYSFPSGHAFVSCCFFLCLAEVLVRDQWPPLRKAVVWSAATACTLLIGLSRVYLGVHYPTDVLAGYAAAIVWTTVIRVGHHAWKERRNAREITAGTTQGG
ncbi:MAG: phosphatase PAP2 family protein [Candidatus Solibacter sp.]